MIWSDDTLSPANARPAVIESAAQMVIAFNPENLTKLVMVVILFVTRPPLWRLDAPNIERVHRHECDGRHMVKSASGWAFPLYSMPGRKSRESAPFSQFRGARPPKPDASQPLFPGLEPQSPCVIHITVAAREWDHIGCNGSGRTGPQGSRGD